MHRQKEIREEVKNQLITGLDDTALIHFSFAENALASMEWKHKKEFKFEGIMYDIVKRKKQDTIYHLWCWKDDKETTLYKEFEAILAKLSSTQPLDQQNQLKWMQFSHTLFCSPIPTWDSEFTYFKRLKPKNPYTDFYNSITLELSTPPPLLG